MFLFGLWFSLDMPRSGIAGSYDSSIFSFLRNFHTILYSGYTNLHSTNSVEGFIFSTPLQHLLFVYILKLAILAGVRYYHVVLLIFISVIISDGKSLFMCFWPSVCLLWWSYCYILRNKNSCSPSSERLSAENPLQLSFLRKYCSANWPVGT